MQGTEFFFGTLRQCFYIEKLRTIGCIVKKDFRQLNKEDMVSLLSGIVEKGFSEGTIDSYHIAIIRFFRWLNGCEKGDVNPAILRVIKRKRPTNKLEQEDLISADDVKKIISCCVLHCKCNSNIRSKHWASSPTESRYLDKDREAVFQKFVKMRDG